jgi:hypothetical protein
MGWESSKRRVNKYLPEIERIIRSIAGDIIEFRESTPEEDQYTATDYVVTVAGGDIACRVREQLYWFKFGDFALRYSRPSGRITEFEKIKNGYGHWYLYAWTWRFSDNKLLAWIFVDLDKLRRSGLLDVPRSPIPSPDNSSEFVTFSLPELWHHNCIIKAHGKAWLRILGMLQGKTPPFWDEYDETEIKR